MVATSNSLHDVYICSGKDDHKVASELCEKLTAANISCFVKPSVFKMDAILARKVTRKIKDARVFVFVFSSLSNENEEILWEIDKALELKKVFITFKMEDACPSDTLAYYIGNTQWMDANSENLSESIRDLQKVLLKVIKQDSDTVVAPNDLKPKKIKRQKSSPVPSTAGYKNLILALVGAVVFAIIIGRYYKYDQIVKKYFIQEKKKELVKETVMAQRDFYQRIRDESWITPIPISPSKRREKTKRIMFGFGQEVENDKVLILQTCRGKHQLQIEVNGFPAIHPDVLDAADQCIYNLKTSYRSSTPIRATI